MSELIQCSLLFKLIEPCYPIPELGHPCPSSSFIDVLEHDLLPARLKLSDEVLLLRDEPAHEGFSVLEVVLLVFRKSLLQFLPGPAKAFQCFPIGLEIKGIFGKQISSKASLHIDHPPQILGRRLLSQIEIVQPLFILREGLQVAVCHDADEDEGGERDRRDEE